MVSTLSKLEKKMVSILEKSENPNICDFGSAEELRASVEAIGRSPMLPEFVRMYVDESRLCDGDEAIECWSFIENSLRQCRSGSALSEIVDLVWTAPESCIERLSIAFQEISFDDTASSAARSAALDGVVRFVIRKPNLRFGLISRLLRINTDDDCYFIRNTAKIIGVIHANWPTSELFDKLVEIAEIEAARDQVAFEIGSCKIQFALNSAKLESIERDLYDSKYWFAESLKVNPDRHDSAIYLECVNCLLNFYQGKSIDAEGISQRFKLHITMLKSWCRSDLNPPWMRRETTQIFYWESLGDRLARLSDELQQPAWYQTAQVVEEYLSAVWSASRSLLKRDTETGVEHLIRPKLARTIAGTVGQAFAVKEWLRRNAGHENHETVQALEKRIDEIVAANATNGSVESQESKEPLADAINRSALVNKPAACQVVFDAQALSLQNLTEHQRTILEECVAFVSCHPDYQKDVYRRLFNAILLFTVRFLDSRLEMTKKDAPAIEYLFKRDDGKRPTEDKLQTDYKNVMLSTMGGTEVEVMNVGGGRADVLFRSGTERLVAEVKREERNSSFANLFEEYSSQAADYQNVSGRLGFVLVLDQTTPTSGTPHISTLVKPMQLTRQGESIPRLLIFVKVPGERLRPSALTKEAKSTSAQKRKTERQSNAGTT